MINYQNMKPLFVILFICSAKLTYAQNIFRNEQKIELSEQLKSQEIEFTSREDGIKLSGSLIYPANEFSKVVIIVPGSGKNTRHSHFVLANEFLTNQIAVFRFDDRGIGKSGGKYNTDTETATLLQKDVVSAFMYLKKLEILYDKKIGILGHSLGGIASIGALENGCDFDFIIQMATPIENNGAFLTYQATTNIVGFFTVKGKTTEEVIQFIDLVRKTVCPDEDYQASKNKAKAIMKELNFGKGKHIIKEVIIDLMKQNHEVTYQSCEIPMLYIIGTEDKTVSCNNEVEILKGLKNPNISISIIDKASHYLNDKSNPKSKISPYYITENALNTIIDWTVKI